MGTYNLGPSVRNAGPYQIIAMKSSRRHEYGQAVVYGKAGQERKPEEQVEIVFNCCTVSKLLNLWKELSQRGRYLHAIRGLLCIR